MSDDDSDVEPSGDIVVGLFLGTGIAFSFREREGNHLRKQSMPVVSSPLPRFEKPLLYTELGMVSHTDLPTFVIRGRSVRHLHHRDSNDLFHFLESTFAADSTLPQNALMHPHLHHALALLPRVTHFHRAGQRRYNHP